MKIKQKRGPRQTVYVVINGVRATTTDMKAFWNACSKRKEKFRWYVDEDGDLIIESVDG